MLLHWLNTELWGPMWPNIFSPNVWTIAAILIHLLVTLAQRERHHREMKKLVAPVAAAKSTSEKGRR
jgi:hypothetical protein